MKTWFYAPLLLIALLVVPGLAYAQMAYSENLYELHKDDTINDDLFVTAETVRIEGTVNGDVFVGGTDVIISGFVTGDVYVVGERVTITGTVGQDLLALSSNLTLTGASIQDGVITAGDRLSMDGTTTIGGTVLLAANKSDVAAQVGRGLLGLAGDLVIGGSVASDVYIAGPALQLSEAGFVGGDLHYVSKREVELSQGSQIVGEITRTPVKQVEAQPMGWIWAAVWGLFGSLLVGGVFLYLMPGAFKAVLKNSEEEPGQSLLIGVAGVFLTPIVILLFLISIVGIPLAGVLMLLYLLAFLVLRVFIAYVIGNSLLKLLKTKKAIAPFFGLALGLVILILVRHLPYVGGWVVFISFVWVAGALLLYAKRLSAK